MGRDGEAGQVEGTWPPPLLQSGASESIHVHTRESSASDLI